MGSFSIWHWLIVLVIVLLIFGTKKLRNLGADLGGAVKGFKDGIKDATTEDKPAETPSPPPAPAPPPQVGTGQTIEGEIREKTRSSLRRQSRDHPHQEQAAGSIGVGNPPTRSADDPAFLAPPADGCQCLISAFPRCWSSPSSHWW